MRAKLFIAVHQLENQVRLPTGTHAHLSPVQYLYVRQNADQYFHSVT